MSRQSFYVFITQDKAHTCMYFPFPVECNEIEIYLQICITEPNSCQFGYINKP